MQKDSNNRTSEKMFVIVYHSSQQDSSSCMEPLKGHDDGKKYEMGGKIMLVLHFVFT